MKLIVVLLSLLTLVSCQEANLWQSIGWAEPEPITLETKTGSAESSEDKVDVVKSFTGDRGSMISFSIAKPDSFKGSILYAQSRVEAEAMAEMLNAKCYSKEKIEDYLRSPIDDPDLVEAMKNTVYLLDEGKNSIVDFIIGFLPTFEKTEDTSEFIASLIDYYDSVKDSIRKGTQSLLDDVFQPLLSLLSTSETPTWGEYVKCQLSINLIGGVFEGMDRTVEGVARILTEANLEEKIFNLETEEDSEELMNALYGVGIEALLEVSSGVISSVLSPVAVYNSISHNYGEVINMKSITDLFSTVGE